MEEQGGFDKHGERELMASSEELTGQLTQALRERDEARRLVASAEQLSADESVAPEHREALAQEYAERLAAADGEVQRLKALVGDRRAEIADEVTALEKERGALEIRQKVGEYTPAQLKSATADLDRRAASLSRLDASLAALLEAETESDVRPASRRAGGTPAVARVAKSSPVELPEEPAAASGGGLRGGIASASAVTPRWLLLGSLGLVVVGGIAVVFLFISAMGGGNGGISLNLPSLPGLFQGGDETPAPTTPTAPIMPTRPTTSPTTSAPSVTATETTVSVDLRSAPNVGSLLIDIAFDPAALQLTQVQAAGLPSGTLFEYSTSPGHVVLGVVTSSGLNNNWSIAYLTFRRAAGAATSGQSAVTVSSVQAHRADTLAQVVFTASPGKVNLSDLSAVGPAIVFG